VNTTRKVLLSLLVVGALGTIVGLGAFSAFSSTTTNSGNSFTAGSVVIGDNDSNLALYSLTNQKPGVTTDRCIKVTYSGSLDSTVKLYTTTPVNASAQYINLTIQKGTQSGTPSPWNDCTGFTADTSGGTPYTGTLSNFASTSTDWNNGLAVNPGAATQWAQNDALVYKFSTSVQDTPPAQNASSGAHTFTWEAQNQ